MTDLQRPPAGGPATANTGSSAVEKGKEAASAAAGSTGQVASATVDAGRQVAGEAAGKATEVAREASNQASALLERAQGQVREQASTQTEKAAGGIRSFSDQLRALGEGQPQSGPAADCVRQMADRLGQVADNLEQRGFDGAVSDIRRFARRKPGLFLLSATAAGFAAGRVGRGLQAGQQQQQQGAV